MTALFLTSSLILYILTLAVSLVLMIVAQKVNVRFVRVLFLFHLLLFIAFLWAYVFKSSAIHDDYHLFFLLFFCSGLIISGYRLRMSKRIVIKVYAALFLFSVPVFIVSPSTLISWITLFPKTGHTVFSIGDSIYLESQQSMLDKSESGSWFKLTRKKGWFTNTLARDIYITGTLDSVMRLSNPNDSTISVRFYYSIAGARDSNDRIFELKPPGPGEKIIRKRK